MWCHKGDKEKRYQEVTLVLGLCHQEVFDAIKQQLAREVMLAYPDYSLPFDIYTDASSRQLSAVITQKGKPIAFFSRKLSETQQNYSVIELELLSIVETLKEFKGMLWGQRIKVFADHKKPYAKCSWHDLRPRISLEAATRRVWSSD